MRIRKLSAIFGATLVLGGCVLLYMITDSTFLPQEYQDNKWMQFEGRLKQLEADLYKHHETVGKLKHTIKELTNNKIQASAGSSVTSSNAFSVNRTVSPRTQQRLASCTAQVTNTPHTDVQLLNLYETMKFENIDGGAWKQGWNIEYDHRSWTPEKKLKVFVVPHSHNDPGWIKTFDDYYNSQTRNILNNLVKKLSIDERRKFIWAEMSFFAKWYEEISSEVRDDVKKLLNNGQLEIVTGGYVMNDEANSHYFSILTQLIEGHQFLLRHFNYRPENSWSIDPFGVSPVMPYILNKMGFKNLVIQRVHYSVKKALARSKNLEFLWRQLWDDTGSTELFTHMMPFYSYDVPHTCGPDPKVCCQFDFRRLPGYGLSCPWKIPPQVITDRNVAHRSEMLLDQYRKKAQLYRTNVVLAPLGDDFRYDQASEWDAQYNNYQKIFDYLNSNEHLNVEAQFGTLTDFFNAIHEEMALKDFPTLSGDFFTYADRDDHYWSGYYTSRPFYKRMDRVLMNYLRAAEIIFALTWGSNKGSWPWVAAPDSVLVKHMVTARKSFSLFQHHDGITGTAKDHVVEDYARKLHEAITGLQHVIQICAYLILSSTKEMPDLDYSYFSLDDSRRHHYSLPEKTVLKFSDTVEVRRVVLYNSLEWKRKELVTVRVASPYIMVTDIDGNAIQSQTTPVVLQSGTIDTENYDISFIGEVPPLGLATYRLHALQKQDSSSKNTHTNLKIYNYMGDLPKVKGFDTMEAHHDGKEFVLSNSHFSAAFSNQGLLKAVTLHHDNVYTPSFPVHLDFVKYSARAGHERSGAYLFLPDGPATMLNMKNCLIYVFEGPLASFVKVLVSEVQHTVTVYNTPGIDSFGIEINNIVDIADHTNYELAMRISTNIKNGDEFFTDLNGMQMIRRKRFSKLPIQANYYPLPAAAYLEDATGRLTLLSGQPLGVASLKQGQIEVMQDRRLNQDDNRGVGQGVLDNHPTPNIFRLVIEKRESGCKTTSTDHPGGFLSPTAYLSSQSLLYPTLRLLRLDSPPVEENMVPTFSPVLREPGSDIHIVSMYTFVEHSAHKGGLILFRQQFDKCFSPSPVAADTYHLSNGLVDVSTIFPSHFGEHIQESSLSFLHYGKHMSKDTLQPLCPMEMTAFTFPKSQT